MQITGWFKPPGGATSAAKVRNCENSLNLVEKSVVALKHGVPRQQAINPTMFLAKFWGLKITLLELSEVAVSRQRSFLSQKQALK